MSLTLVPGAGIRAMPALGRFGSVNRVQRMTDTDARWHWMSPTMRSDQFLVYGFATPTATLDDIALGLLTRARAIDDLTLRIVDVPGGLDRPYWRRTSVAAEQVRIVGGAMTWSQCLDRIAASMVDQVDARRHPWRLHLYGSVSPAPDGVAGDDLTVAVLQVSHALGDGRRTSSIARELFSAPDVGRTGVDATGSVPAGPELPEALAVPVAVLRGALRLPVATAQMLTLGALAFHRSRKSAPATVSGVRPTSLNAAPGSRRVIRTLTVRATRLTTGGHSVTVGALTAISVALPHYLAAAQGEPAHGGTTSRATASDPTTITLTMARTDTARPVLSRNNFRTVSIDLHTEIDDLDARASAIAAEIDSARTEHLDAAAITARQAEQATPAPLRILGVRQFDPETIPDRIDGISVVSSVHRGPADLVLGGGQSRFTAGFPALSPVHGLNHGVHGLGENVTLSVIASPRVCSDLDRYMNMLSDAVTS